MLSIFTLLCNQPPELLHLAKLKLWIHHTITLTPSCPPALGNHYSTSCLCDFTLDTSYKWNLAYLSFCDWLISLNTKSSMFIHVVAGDKISLFFKAEYYSFVCVYHILFLHSSVNGQLGCFHLKKLILIAIKTCLNCFWPCCLIHPSIHRFFDLFHKGFKVIPRQFQLKKRKEKREI